MMKDVVSFRSVVGCRCGRTPRGALRGFEKQMGPSWANDASVRSWGFASISVDTIRSVRRFDSLARDRIFAPERSTRRYVAALKGRGPGRSGAAEIPRVVEIGESPYVNTGGTTRLSRCDQRSVARAVRSSRGQGGI